MKKILILILLASCSYDELITVKSTNTNQTNNKYTFDNDSVTIVYNFWAERGTMNFRITNKLNKPIYIDWGNSGLIRNGGTVNYWYDETQSTSTTKSVGYGRYSDNSGLGVGKSKTNTTIYKPSRIEAIPPHTYVDRGQPGLLGEEWSMPDTGTNWEKSNSPLVFRNYLVLSDSPDIKTQFFVDNEFYIGASEIIREDYFAIGMIPYKFYMLNVKITPYTPKNGREPDMRKNN